MMHFNGHLSYVLFRNKKPYDLHIVHYGPSSLLRFIILCVYAASKIRLISYRIILWGTSAPVERCINDTQSYDFFFIFDGLVNNVINDGSENTCGRPPNE